jgi:hypothetical protein
VILNFCSNVFWTEKRHPRLRLSDWRRLTFDDLTTLLFFGSVKACLFACLGHHWILAHVSFSLFTVTLSLSVVFTAPINSAGIRSHLLRLTLAQGFLFLPSHGYSFHCVCLSLVHVSPKFGSMASDEALAISAEQRETSIEQLEESLGGQQMVTSAEASSSHEAAAPNHESLSRDSEDSEIGSDTPTRLKVATVAALASITYDFGQSTMMETRLGSL